ncbi:MAG: MFS transporter [Bradymonadales bacterium]|nr:MFS transporter [Bradymonadales bacterium]
MAASPVINNVRALTWSSYTAMFFLGVGITLVGAVARTIGLEAHQIGLLISVQHLGFAIAVVVSGTLADVVGKTRLLLAGSILLGPVFLFLFGGSVFWVNLVLMLVMGAGIGVYEGVTDAWLIDLHRERQSRYVSINHFFVTIGEIGITLYLVFWAVGWRGSLVGSGVAVLLLAAFFALADQRPRTQANTSFLGQWRILRNRRPLILLFVIAILTVGIELGTMGYLTTYLGEIRGFGHAESQMGLVLFLLGVAVGRLIIGLVVREDQVMRWVALLFAVASGAFVLLYTTDLGRLSFVVVFLSGFSVSATFPLLISLVARAAPEASGAAIGLLKVTIPLGGMVVAFLISRLSRTMPLQMALLAIPAAALLGLLVVLALSGLDRRFSIRCR